MKPVSAARRNDFVDACCFQRRHYLWLMLWPFSRFEISRTMYIAHYGCAAQHGRSTEAEVRAQPNAQAALLIRLVRQYPDTIERLASV